jgi:hypothetical protein
MIQTPIGWLQSALWDVLTEEQKMQTTGLFHQAMDMEQEIVAKGYEDGQSVYPWEEMKTGKQYYEQKYGRL